MSKSKRNFSRFLPFAFSDRSVPSCTQSRRRGRGFEALEDRRMMAVNITFNPLSSATEGSNDAPFFVITGDLSAASPAERTISVNNIGGSASLGTDYTLSSIILPAKVYSGDVVKLSDLGGVVTLQDVLIEGDESFAYQLVESSPQITINGDKSAFAVINASHTIVDNDKATITVSDSINEVTGLQQFTVTLDTDDGTGKANAQLLGDVKVTISELVGGTATSGVDYGAFGATVIEFKATGVPQDHTVDLNITTNNDTLIEGDETILIGVSAPTGGGVTSLVKSQTGVLTIIDDDTFDIIITPTAKAVPEPGTSTKETFEVKILFTTPGSTLTQDVVVSLAAGGGTNAEPTDYFLHTNSVKFSAAAKSGDTQTGSVTIFGDDLVEIDELVSIVADVTGGLKSQEINKNDSFDLTIIDNDVTKIVISSAKQSEGAGNIVVTVTLLNPVDEDVILPFEIDSSSTASDAVNVNFTGDPDDFDVLTGNYDAKTNTGSLKLIAGQTQTSFTIAVNNDITVEDDETIVVELTSNPLAGLYNNPLTRTNLPGDTTTAADLKAAQTIVNDDAALVSIIGQNALENVGPLTWLVVLSRPSETDTTIDYSDLLKGTAKPGGVDYDLTSPGAIVIKAGQQVGTIIATSITNDATAEGNETVVVNLDKITSDRNVSLDPLAKTGTSTIVDDDVAQASVAKVLLVDEGKPNAEVTVTLTSAPVSDVVVDFTTSNGSATAGADYKATTGQVTILAGQTQGTILVPLIDDGLIETDEDFFVTLTGVSKGIANVNPAANKTAVTIQDNDFAALSIQANVAANEGDGKAVIVLTRSGSTDVAFKATLVAIAGIATDGADYISGTLTTPVSFAIGQTTATAVINLVNDGVSEAIETFSVKITGVDSGAVAITNQDTALVSITDNDVSVVDLNAIANVTEKNSGDFPTATIQVSIPTAAADDIVVTYNAKLLLGNTAETTDFAETLGGIILIAKGKTTGTTTVAITGDNIIEGNETFSVEITGLASTVPVAKGVSTQTVTIVDDDSAQISLSNETVTEGSKGKTIVSLPAGTVYEGDIKVTVTSSVGGLLPGTAGTDFKSGESVTVTLTGGATSAVATLGTATTNDEIVEPDETFRVEILAGGIVAQGNITEKGGDANAVVTIEDNDSATISVIDLTVADKNAVSEGAGSALVQVKITGATKTTTIQNAFNFKFDTVNGTAAEPGDYTKVSALFGFLAGAKHDDVISIPISIIDDLLIESTENIGTLLSGLADDPAKHGNVTILDGVGTVEIVDNDSATVSITKIQDGVEGVANGSFLVTLSQPVGDADVTVTFDRTGTAKAGADYSGVPTSVVFTKGQTSTVISVNVVDDTLFEPTESVVMTILSVVGSPDVKIGAPSQATVNISSGDTLVVSDVLVSGNAWANAPYSILNGKLHDVKNANSTLSWVNLDQLHIAFNVDDSSYIDALAPTNIALTGVSKGAYTTKFDTIVGGEARFDIVDAKGVLTAIGADRLTLTVQGQVGDPDPVTGLGGAAFLNGGLDSTFKFNVLPGDIVDSGIVNNGDFASFAASFGQPAASFGRADLNGSGGTINNGDFAAFATTFGTSLPAPAVAAAIAAVMAGDDAAADDDDPVGIVDDALDLAFSEL